MLAALFLLLLLMMMIPRLGSSSACIVGHDVEHGPKAGDQAGFVDLKPGGMVRSGVLHSFGGDADEEEHSWGLLREVGEVFACGAAFCFLSFVSGNPHQAWRHLRD